MKTNPAIDLAALFDRVIDGTEASTRALMATGFFALVIAFFTAPY